LAGAEEIPLYFPAFVSYIADEALHHLQKPGLLKPGCD
jgi:hypothetical protein